MKKMSMMKEAGNFMVAKSAQPVEQPHVLATYHGSH